ncbi:hypothetical protein K9L97_00485 [Candidatus Woesearchaeota archaeon]|nr:hypothetical protein [Candidatus Woesearchaeota archaeon]
MVTNQDYRSAKEYFDNIWSEQQESLIDLCSYKSKQDFYVIADFDDSGIIFEDKKQRGFSALDLSGVTNKVVLIKYASFEFSFKENTNFYTKLYEDMNKFILSSGTGLEILNPPKVGLFLFNQYLTYILENEKNWKKTTKKEKSQTGLLFSGYVQDTTKPYKLTFENSLEDLVKITEQYILKSFSEIERRPFFETNIKGNVRDLFTDCYIGKTINDAYIEDILKATG